MTASASRRASFLGNNCVYCGRFCGLGRGTVTRTVWHQGFEPDDDREVTEWYHRRCKTQADRAWAKRYGAPMPAAE